MIQMDCGEKILWHVWCGKKLLIQPYLSACHSAFWRSCLSLGVLNEQH